MVGTTSFGKGTFQEVIPLNNGGALDLTVGEYLTRNGTSINGIGITPAGEGEGQPLAPRPTRGASGPSRCWTSSSEFPAPQVERRVVLVSKRGRFLVGELLFERGGQIELGGGRRAATPGRMALVELGQGRGRARVVRQLGDPRLAADVLDAMLEDRQIRVGFSRRIEEEAGEAAARAAALDVDRRDLRDLPTFTVDPATAHDFDDAVSASRTERGVRLWIHIADVAAHVRPGAPLEKEAYRRANSTYVPGRVEPMLPHALSSDACSLAPERGSAGGHRRDRALGVRRAAVGELLPQPDPLGRPPRLRPARRDLRRPQPGRRARSRSRSALARQAAAALAGRRPRSSLEVESFEPEFRFEDGQVTGAHSVPQTEAHRLIEHLMILTNERVAELLERRRVPTLYRVHEQPDPERIRRLVEQLAALDIPTPPLPERSPPSRRASSPGRRAGWSPGRPSVAATAARRIHRSCSARCKQAHYADRNLGHAGLGSPAYSHFTSPIRRYPDLVAHRALLAAIGAGEEAPRAEGLAEVAAHCSERERDATRSSATPTRSAPRSCSSASSSSGVPTPGSRGRSRAWSAPAPSSASAASSPTSTRASFPLAGSAAASATSSTRPRRCWWALVAGGAIRLGDPVKVAVDRVEAPRGRVDLVPAES